MSTPDKLPPATTVDLKDEAFREMLAALKDFISSGAMECCCGETPCCGSCTITQAKNAVAKAEAIQGPK